MIRVHHLNNSRSQRVLWLLEEAGVPYEVTRYERDPKTMLAPRALRQIHPLGKSPVVEIDGQVLAETGFIVAYLTATLATRLRPEPGTAEYWRFLYWLHYAEGSAMPPMLLRLVLNRLGPLGWPARKYSASQIGTHLRHMEKAVSGASWFVSTGFSTADIMMSFPIECAQSLGLLGGDYPALKEYLARIHARPAYERALKAGGPYSLGR